jgi:Amt family ammonium transporter
LRHKLENHAGRYRKRSLLDEYGANLGVVVERRKQELALGAARQQAETSAAQAKDALHEALVANRTKSDFLANVSHELRTPLNAIIGFSEVMVGGVFGKLDDRYHGYAEDIYKSGALLLQIVTDILDVSEIERGNYELDEEAIDISNLIETTFVMVRDRAENARVQLRYRVLKSDGKLYADARRVKQILINLVSNAIKFSNNGGQVDVIAGQAKDGRYMLHVTDRGRGIDPKDIPRLLTPFDRGGDPMVRDQEGYGLGLSIVNSLARMHGAVIGIDSKLGRGTLVTVAFPANRVVREKQLSQAS